MLGLNSHYFNIKRPFVCIWDDTDVLRSYRMRILGANTSTPMQILPERCERSSQTDSDDKDGNKRNRDVSITRINLKASMRSRFAFAFISQKKDGTVFYY
jgi:hypothetical protein